ncbi:Sortase (surface protein transpeptidase) [Lacticaseibacillus paracasei]|nr:Sortase (surface protein transpeptidase) [Lacticaseibacillus paracasei]
MTKRTRRPLGLIDIVIGCLLLAGFGVLCYPFASDAYVSYQNQQVIDRYRQQEARKNQMVLRRDITTISKKINSWQQVSKCPALPVLIMLLMIKEPQKQQPNAINKP